MSRVLRRIDKKTLVRALISNSIRVPNTNNKSLNQAQRNVAAQGHMTETNLENLEVPNPETVIVLPDTQENQPVAFDERQQALFDRKLKESHGRIAKEARAEAERLRLENIRLKEVAAGQGSQDELERVRGELASARLEQQAILDKAVAQSKDLLIAQEAAKARFVDIDTMQRLVRGNLRHDAATGTFTVVNDDGTPRLNAVGDPLPVSEFFEDYGNKKPWLVKGSVIPGTGSSGSGNSVPPPQKPLSFYFGPSSNAAAINALSLRDPATYRRLRAEAVRAGLIGGN